MAFLTFVFTLRPRTSLLGIYLPKRNENPRTWTKASIGFAHGSLNVFQQGYWGSKLGVSRNKGTTVAMRADTWPSLRHNLSERSQAGWFPLCKNPEQAKRIYSDGSRSVVTSRKGVKGTFWGGGQAFNIIMGVGATRVSASVNSDDCSRSVQFPACTLYQNGGKSTRGACRLSFVITVVLQNSHLK